MSEAKTALNPKAAWPFPQDRKELEAERDALKEQNAELVEALRYWLPDESWMMEKYPNHKHDAWGTFYEHAALLSKASK